MLPFIVGTVVGWTAARIVPSPINERIKPPTLDEIQLLATKSKDFFTKIKQKLDEDSSR